MRVPATGGTTGGHDTPPSPAPPICSPPLRITSLAERRPKATRKPRHPMASARFVSPSGDVLCLALRRRSCALEQPHQPARVVGRALQCDGQQVACQGHCPHALAALLCQAGKDVLDPRPGPVDGVIALVQPHSGRLAGPGSPGDAVLQTACMQRLPVGLAVVAAVGEQPPTRVG